MTENRFVDQAPRLKLILMRAVVPPVTIYGRLLKKNEKCNVQKFQCLINGTLSSGKFLKFLANKQEAVGTYFASGFVDQ